MQKYEIELYSKRDSLTPYRSINVKTKHVHGQAATDHIVPTRKTTRLANDQDVIIA